MLFRSRTDAGVHATGQAASFECDAELEPRRLVAGVSALCRPDAAVVAADRAPAGFNARFASRGKRYRYRLLNRPAPSPLFAGVTWHVTGALDRAAMQDAAARLVGTHDFAGFRSADCGRESTERTITAVRLEPGLAPQSIDVVVEGTAFLKNMVRILVGTLVEVGHGKLPPDRVDRVLASGDRTEAGVTAPAHGLTLERVFFEDDWPWSRSRVAQDHFLPPSGGETLKSVKPS